MGILGSYTQGPAFWMHAQSQKMLEMVLEMYSEG
ncbi:hypothetical protein N787_03190 [Arenimonas metalli CF5-1]|uniref:Uncharacterized protein n=1 Tax=Arenimonas metalli CF5-1 TaxID=1384056 RepID=A0A091B0B1_9GAMM|nr:hypothetical protein N787_03190 [Arenimonas metalli CF5-1]